MKIAKVSDPPKFTPKDIENILKESNKSSLAYNTFNPRNGRNWHANAWSYVIFDLLYEQYGEDKSYKFNIAGSTKSLMNFASCIESAAIEEKRLQMFLERSKKDE